MMAGKNTDVLARLRNAPDDANLWHEFWKEVHPAVMYTVLRSGAGRALAEDIAQETFLRFFQSDLIHKIQNESAIPYARQIARNLLLDWRRKQARWRPLDQEAENVPAPSVDLEPADEWRHRDLEQLTPGLNARDRALLELRLAGLDIREIAQRLQITYSSAAVRVHRLIKLLKYEAKLGVKK